MTVKVTDAGGLPATQSFQFTVAPVAVPNVQGLAPEWAEAMLQAAGLNTGAKSSQGGAITLNFDTLPSKQGWGYGTTYSTIPEAQVFSLVPGALKQDTMGAGTTANRYFLDGVVGSRLPFIMDVRARILAEEPLNSLPGFQPNVIRGGETIFGRTAEALLGVGIERVYGIGGSVLK